MEDKVYTHTVRALPSLPQADEDDAGYAAHQSADITSEQTLMAVSSRLTASGNLESALAYILSFRGTRRTLLDESH